MPLAASPSVGLAICSAGPGATCARQKQRTQRLIDDNYKIYVDAAQPATLNDGAGKLIDCATLREAVMAWHRQRPEQTKRVTIKVFGGPVYTVSEIVRLHFGPKPE
jgi:hypothetical protein